MSLTTPPADHTATRLARSASALMLLSAATSAYWATGGTGLLDTVGGSIARWGHDGGASVRLALTAIVVLKLVAAWLPVRAVRQACPRAVRRLAWLQAAILTVYGGVLTGTGLAVQAGLVGAGVDADWKALDWHVYLWDPWFLVVGLLVGVALRRTRNVGPRAHGAPIRPWQTKPLDRHPPVAPRHGGALGRCRDDRPRPQRSSQCEAAEAVPGTVEVELAVLPPRPLSSTACGV